MRTNVMGYIILSISAVCFCQESRITDAEIIKAQKRILERIASQNSSGRTSINRYVRMGYPEDAFELGVIKESVARSILSEIESSDINSRNKLLYLNIRKYRLSYDYLAGFVKKRDNLKELLDKYLAAMNESEKRKLYVSLKSRMFSIEEIPIVIDYLSEAKTNADKLKLLQLITAEPSNFFAEYVLFNMLGDNNKQVRTKATSILLTYQYFNTKAIRKAITTAIDKNDEFAMEELFKFLKDQYRYRHAASRIIKDYFEIDSPLVIAHAAKSFSYDIQEPVVKRMFEILADEKYSSSHEAIIKCLTKALDNDKDGSIPPKMTTFFTETPNKELVIVFIGSISNTVSWHMEKEHFEGLIKSLNKIAEIYDEDVNRRFTEKIAEIRSFAEQHYRIKENPELRLLDKFFEHYEEFKAEVAKIPHDKLDKKMPPKKRKKFYDDLLTECEQLILAVEKRNPDYKELPALKRKLKEMKADIQRMR